MSVFFAPGLPDHVAARALGMSVFTNPIQTEGQYRLGLRGVRACLPRLASACAGHWQPLCSVLGDVAACVGIDAEEEPLGSVRTSAINDLYFRLRRAVRNRDLIAVRDLVVRMLRVMRLRWHPSADWHQLYGPA
jgi:hypothetical protein